MENLLKTWSNSDLRFMALNHFKKKLEFEDNLKELNNEIEIMGKEIKKRGLEMPLIMHSALNLADVIKSVNARFPEKKRLENECQQYVDSIIKETDYRDRPIHIKYAFKAGVNYLNEFLNGR